jgi:hypothetical protein
MTLLATGHRHAGFGRLGRGGGTGLRDTTEQLNLWEEDGDMRTHRTIKVAVLLVLLGLPASGRADIIYDAAADFSPISNPNGVWSYGWSPTLGGTFHLYTDSVRDDAGADVWRGNQGGIRGEPAVVHNGTDMPLVGAGTNVLQPGQMGFHPGPHGEFSVVRWTAPNDGLFAIVVTFTGLDFVGPTTTDVHTLNNGTALFDGLVAGFGPNSATSFDGTLSVRQGDTIDFTVGWGLDGNYFYDLTGLAATIAPVPEPAALLLLGISTFGVIGWAWRRRTQTAQDYRSPCG